MSRTARPKRPRPPLDRPALERLALRYVERYATTRARLTDYLNRKLRERGWAEDGDPDPRAIAEHMAELGYVDDRAFAEARAASMGRRGLGARRVTMALRQAGIEENDAESVAPLVSADAVASALAYARRRRIGPYGAEAPERDARERQIAAMLRAGHRFELVRRIVDMAPGDDAEAMLESD